MIGLLSMYHQLRCHPQVKSKYTRVVSDFARFCQMFLFKAFICLLFLHSAHGTLIQIDEKASPLEKFGALRKAVAVVAAPLRPLLNAPRVRSICEEHAV